jgi:hypothetical protein
MILFNDSSPTIFQISKMGCLFPLANAISMFCERANHMARTAPETLNTNLVLLNLLKCFTKRALFGTW